jgi:hypothetical protein
LECGLPSFLLGHAVHGRGHHHIRGYVAIAVGVILLILVAVAARIRRRAYWVWCSFPRGRAAPAAKIPGLGQIVGAVLHPRRSAQAESTV